MGRRKTNISQPSKASRVTHLCVCRRKGNNQHLGHREQLSEQVACFLLVPLDLKKSLFIWKYKDTKINMRHLKIHCWTVKVTYFLKNIFKRKKKGERMSGSGTTLQGLVIGSLKRKMVRYDTMQYNMQVTENWLCHLGQVRGGRYIRKKLQFLGLGDFCGRRMEILNPLIVLIHLQVHTYVKICYVVHIKYVQLLVCQLYLNKAERKQKNK